MERSHDSSNLRSLCFFIAGAFTCWLAVRNTEPGLRLSASCDPVCALASRACQRELEVKNSLVRKLWSKLVTLEKEGAATNADMSNHQLPIAAMDQMIRQRHAAKSGERLLLDEVKTGLSNQERSARSPSGLANKPSTTERASTRFDSWLRSQNPTQAEELFERFKMPGDKRASDSGLQQSQQASPPSLAPSVARQKQQSWRPSAARPTRATLSGTRADAQRCGGQQQGEGTDHSGSAGLGVGQLRWGQQRKFHCIQKVANGSSENGSGWVWLPC